MIDVVVGDLGELAAMRQRVAHFARDGGAPAGDVVLAANELATNSLEHTGGSCRVTGTWPSARVIRIAVADRGGFVFDFPSGPAHSRSIAGRGLTIVRAVASRCGIIAEADATSVWFEIDVAADPPQAPASAPIGTADTPEAAQVGGSPVLRECVRGGGLLRTSASRSRPTLPAGSRRRT